MPLQIVPLPVPQDKPKVEPNVVYCKDGTTIQAKVVTRYTLNDVPWLIVEPMAYAFENQWIPLSSEDTAWAVQESALIGQVQS